MKKSLRGFTLIELLIVVAIILIIAAIAIPNLLKSKIAANQASAVSSLRTLGTAEATYQSTYNIGYSSYLGYLGSTDSSGNSTFSSAGLLDNVLSNAAASATTDASSKSGYFFSYAPSDLDATTGQYYDFSAYADPIEVNTTGINHYFIDQTAVIRFVSGGTTSASAASNPLNG